ncbi:MAG: hypothetical protein IH840_11660, partial [Candidatus Heimdallarchaeota archaeon]|nr:hypothetical protein [Candidatus Heimdallarchaeota archaeon]
RKNLGFKDEKKFYHLPNSDELSHDFPLNEATPEELLKIKTSFYLRNPLSDARHLLNLGMIFLIASKIALSNPLGEDSSVSYRRTIFSAIFAYWDVVFVGLAIITYLSMNKHHLKRFQIVLLFSIYFIWTILSLTLRYFEAFSFGNQVPFENLELVNLLNGLRLILIMPFVLFSRHVNPVFDRIFGRQIIPLPVVLMGIDILLTFRA